MGRLRYIRLTRRQRVRVWLAIILLALTALLAAILLHLRPMLENLATARCANTVSRIVVAAVNDAVENGWMEYDRLVKFDKDSDGRVTALSSNMAEFNRLQTAVAARSCMPGWPETRCEQNTGLPGSIISMACRATSSWVGFLIDIAPQMA